MSSVLHMFLGRFCYFLLRTPHWRCAPPPRMAGRRLSNLCPAPGRGGPDARALGVGRGVRSFPPPAAAPNGRGGWPPPPPLKDGRDGWGGQMQSFDSTRKNDFTKRSSNEWKLIVAIRPPGLRIPRAAFNPDSISPNSLLTAMRMP